VVRPGPDGEVWVRWHEVQDMAASGPRDRHYVLERVGGTVRFGDGRHGMIPPEGSANVRIGYRTGGGPEGNRTAGNLVQLKTALPYVESVVNHIPASGGAAAEDLESIRQRGPRKLRHRDRAIAVADYEDLAFEASPAVARSRGIAASGIDDAGQVTLVVVGRSTERRPAPTLAVVESVRAYVEARMQPTVELIVRGPEWLEVSVDVSLVPVALDRANEVAGAVDAALDAFLHPLSGGPGDRGWDFGRRPHRSDFFRLIERLDGVDHVSSLSVATSDVPRGPFLVCAGTHAVTIEGGEA
jgi:predicted phage baseplate assembly protein